MQRELKQTKSERLPTWIWWALGFFALLAYWNYADRDQRPTRTNVMAGMTSVQMLQFKDCVEHSNSNNLSDYTNGEMCRKIVLGQD